MAKKQLPPRAVVILKGYSILGNMVYEENIKYAKYYGSLNPVIDDSDFRVDKRIRRLTGEVYDYDGELQSRFETHYDESGDYVRSRAVHADGTVVED